MSNVVNIYITGALTGMIVLPVLTFLPEHFLGRKLVLASRELLGPIWLQILMICLSLSFYKYWMHRLQHSVPFLWELHSYHHRVTDLQATNTLVSHPIDFALRNVPVWSCAWDYWLQPVGARYRDLCHVRSRTVFSLWW